MTCVRKAVLVTGILFGLAVFGAAFTTEPHWAIVRISIALGGLAAAAPVGWSIPSLICPKGGAGTAGGIMIFAINLMGVVAPVTTGCVVGLTNSFSGAFLIAGVVLHIGIFSSSRSWDGSSRFLIRAAHPAGLVSILVNQCD
jgi:hypothetical protein